MSAFISWMTGINASSPTEGQLGRQRLFILFSFINTVLLWFSFASPTWIKGGVKYETSRMSAFETPSAADAQDVCLASPLGESGPLGASVARNYHFGLLTYKTKSVEDGTQRESTCYYPTQQAFDYWNSESDSNPDLVNQAHMSKGDLDAVAVLIGIAALVQTWMTVAVWRFSHGKPALPTEDVGDQWFMAVIGKYLRAMTGLCCPDNSEAGALRSLWAHAGFQVFGWLCVVAGLIAFSAAKLKYLVCKLTDPDSTVFCGYSDAWGCAVAAAVLLAINVYLAFTVMRPADGVDTSSSSARPSSSESASILGSSAKGGADAWTASATSNAL